MDLLKKELERKRKAIELAKRNASSSAVIGNNNNNDDDDDNSGSKKKKRAMLRTAELRKFQEEQEEEDLMKRRSKKMKRRTNRKDDDDENRGERKKSGDHRSDDDDDDDVKNSKLSFSSNNTKHQSLSSTNKDDSNNNNNKAKEDKQQQEEEKLPKEHDSNEKITSLLRSLGQPIKFFGESNYSRYKRYQQALEMLNKTNVVLSEMDEYKLGSGHGIRNPFLGGGGGNHDADADGKSNDAKAEDENDAEKEEEEEEEDDPHKRIHRFFKSLLRQWEEDLLNRPDHIKRTAAGKNETKTLKQCRDYIRPLFKLCKSRRLEGNMMNHILTIVQCCKDGEFVKAHDAYMDVAIGRAAWPIGVTMVGIHARSGRAKIESSNVAHVMNSELQRKYLTSVKRLMSYCQKKRTDVDPSKKVMNL